LLNITKDDITVFTAFVAFHSVEVMGDKCWSYLLFHDGMLVHHYCPFWLNSLKFQKY
jgi:L-rhamnose isomerase